MATRALEKASDANGYGDARVLVKACYVGILALRAGWMDVVDHLKTKLEVFQQAYAQRYLPDGGASTGLTLEQQAVAGAPFGNQIRRDIENFAGSFDYEKYNGVHIRGDAQDMLYELVDEADVLGIHSDSLARLSRPSSATAIGRVILADSYRTFRTRKGEAEAR